MRATRAHIVTYRNDPADAEIVSHRLMTRAGFIYKVSSGLYAFTPLMQRVIRKVADIVREELESAGALEVTLPIMQSEELWRSSGRWDRYRASGTMLVVKDRKGTRYGLAPTAEEVMTAYASQSVTSYKQLPINLFQIHTKFRDELRPRFGLFRCKEFLMKDAYSFDVDEKALDVSYEAMRVAYHRIFNRCGLEAFGVDADAGDIGGSGSMEFMLAADAGEDAILLEASSGYAANVEKAISRFAKPAQEDPKALRIEDTPNIRTCEELADFFPDVPTDRMVKTILFKAVHADHEQLWAALIRGDQEVNEIKLHNHAGGIDLKMLTADEIRTHTGAEQGFAGPIDLPKTFELVADKTVRGMCNLLCGLNQTDKHALDVAIGRDFPEPTYADFRLARRGEPGPKNGDPLELRRGIEVGHIFKLGSVYSEPMGATFMAENGRAKPFVMGCYGIGVSRTAAAAVEQYADDNGIVWPVPIAPFEVAVAFLTKKNAETIAAAEACYEGLKAAGIDALLDDRKMSPGAKMKDLEMIGYPYSVLFGRTFEKEGLCELRTRRGSLSVNVAPEAVVEQVIAMVQAARGGIVAD